MLPLFFIAKVILSPLVILIVGTIVTGDFRKGYLIALVIYTVVSSLSIIAGLFKNARPSRVLGLFFTSIRGIFFVVTLFIYWLIYLLTWGADFTL